MLGLGYLLSRPNWLTSVFRISLVFFIRQPNIQKATDQNIQPVEA